MATKSGVALPVAKHLFTEVDEAITASSRGYNTALWGIKNALNDK